MAKSRVCLLLLLLLLLLPIMMDKPPNEAKNAVSGDSLAEL